MKNLIVAIIIFALGALLGRFLLSPQVQEGDIAAASGSNEPLYWVAPMDKNYRRDGPGKSPMGMDLVPVYENDLGSGEDDNAVQISSAVENNLGVKVAPVLREKLVFPIETVGIVQFDESRIQHVHSRVEGWIERLGVAASGDPVTKGQTLYELYSPALVSAQEEYLAAVRSGNKSLIKASSARLYALGLTPSQAKELARRGKVEPNIKVVSEQDGVVIDLNVRKGMYIKPSTEVLSVGSLDSVWVKGEVFERQAHLIKQGQTVEVSLNSASGDTWNGYVNYIYPELSVENRTLNIRVGISNPEHSLKPNMLVNLRVLDTDLGESLSIPRQALIKAGNHHRVVKSLGEGRYQSVLVKTGKEGWGIRQKEAGDIYENRVQILDGLVEGDSVVVSAQFLIDSESNVDAELARMEEGNGAEASTGSKDSTRNKVVAKGVITKLMPQMNMMSIDHEPIPAWDWPQMKMDFELDEGVELSGLSEGDSITFELEKTGDWDYRVIAIGDEAGQEASQKQNIPEGAVLTSGTVKELMLDMNMLEVVHVPIPEWEWPEMSMMFSLAPNEEMPVLVEGDEVSFVLQELENGDYQMSQIEVKKDN